jgi:hypothetical protein
MKTLKTLFNEKSLTIFIAVIFTAFLILTLGNVIIEIINNPQNITINL